MNKLFYVLVGVGFGVVVHAAIAYHNNTRTQLEDIKAQAAAMIQAYEDEADSDLFFYEMGALSQMIDFQSVDCVDTGLL